MKSVKVADYMTRRVITVAPHTSVVAAMGLMLEHKISGMPVVTDSGQLVGMLSEVDAMRVVVQGSYYDESTGVAADFMHAPVDTVAPDLDIYSLAEMFIGNHRRRYPVVTAAGALVGQISRRDVLKVAHASLMHSA